MPRREPKSQATKVYPTHSWAPNLWGPMDHKQRPIECLRCPFPRGNAVHADTEAPDDELPETPPEAKVIDERILGEN